MNYIVVAAFIALTSGASMAQDLLPVAPTCAVLWKNDNFFPSYGDYSIGDNERHDKLHGFNDKESAAAVREGCTLTLYNHDYFRAPLQTIVGPAVVTHANGGLIFNDKASSAECFCGNTDISTLPPQSDGCTLYGDSHFNAWSFKLAPDDEFAQFSEDIDNKVSSVIVGPYCVLEAFDQWLFTGMPQRYATGWYPTLTPNDSMTSARCTCEFAGG